MPGQEVTPGQGHPECHVLWAHHGSLLDKLARRRALSWLHGAGMWRGWGLRPTRGTLYSTGIPACILRVRLQDGPESTADLGGDSGTEERGREVGQEGKELTEGSYEVESPLGTGGSAALGALEKVGGGGCSVAPPTPRSCGRGLLVGGSSLKCLASCREPSGTATEAGPLEAVERAVGWRVLGSMSGHHTWHRRQGDLTAEPSPLPSQGFFLVIIFLCI